jgi:hypothetical protein
MQQSFESWLLSSPPVPPRSQLYSLQPVGVGSGMVESLTGYVARLAEAHSVSVEDLVGRVLSDLADPKEPIITAAAKAISIGGHGFRACSYAINGVTDRAAKWVKALEAATTRRDLRCLTLLPYRHTLPDHLFRRHRAWCRLCFDQWRASGHIVYEPLLWAIEVSTHCIVHARPLDSICRHCARTLSPLGVFSQPGHCERCAGWLGASDTHSRRPELGGPDCTEETWPSRQVGGLLATLPRIDPVAARDSFRRSLAGYLEQIAEGNVLALAQHIRCPHSILQNWLDGATVPRLENLLRTCRFLNIPASSLFDPSGPTPGNIAAAREAIALTGNRGVSPSRHANEIRQALLVALDEPVPRSLSEVARGLGYTNTERLYQADRKLCHEIAARYRQSGRSHWWRKPGATRICDAARLKEILEQSLKSDRPTSAHQIAVSLGYSNDGYVHQKYPELCRAIGEKIALAKQAQPDYMRRTLEYALHEHPTPTLTELSRRLSYSSSTVLRAHEPDLCERLAAQRRAQVVECRADLERKAAAALKENPVPSLRDLCKRLVITVGFMNKYFPAVRRAIAEEHRRWVLSATARRRERLFLDTRNIAAELQDRGLYPSVNRIVENLPEGSCTEWKSITLAVREAQRTLGISK